MQPIWTAGWETRMGVLDAFASTWPSARSTFGQGTPKTGDGFSASGQLRALQADVKTAAPGSRWAGSAASAYQAVNIDHGRVLGEIARLDDQLKTHIDQSARLVANGRNELNTVRKWVFDAAGAVPKT